jgi:hypothetical protein
MITFRYWKLMERSYPLMSAHTPDVNRRAGFAHGVLFVRIGRVVPLERRIVTPERSDRLAVFRRIEGKG